MKLLIDCNNLCYMSAYVFDNLSYDQKQTGVIYGFLNQVLKMAKEFETDEFIFCWDSKKSFRKLFYPQYKATRKQNWTDEQLERWKISFKQFAMLRKEIFPAMGLRNVFVQAGYEADDLIAWIVARYPDDYVIASSDNDLWQLLYEGRKCSVKNYNLKTRKVFTASDFQKGWGIEPDRWVKAKAIAGDTSDNVPGVEGVGLLTAIRFLMGSLDGKKRQRIEASEDLVNRNFHLIALPYPGPVPIEVELKEEEFYSLDFRDVFVQYGFNSYLGDRFEDWRGSFKLIDGRR